MFLHRLLTNIRLEIQKQINIPLPISLLNMDQVFEECNEIETILMTIEDIFWITVNNAIICKNVNQSYKKIWDYSNR